MSENRSVQFTVYGSAQPAGSKTAFALRRRDGSLVTRDNGSPVINVTDDNKKSKGWKSVVGGEAANAMRGVAMLEGPLRVVMRFFRPRPKGHFGSKGTLNKKGRETTGPITKPDVLKLARGVEDAMTGIVYRDDAQITSELIEKEWGEPARVDVLVECRKPEHPMPTRLLDPEVGEAPF